MDQTAITETLNNQDPNTGRFVAGNAAARTHGAFSARIPKIRGIKKLKKELGKLRAQLEANVPELNAQKLLLIDQIIRSETQLRLIEYYLGKHGILRPDSFRKNTLELHPALANSYLSFLNAQKQALVSLGITHRKEDQPLDVRAYARETYDKKGGKKGAKRKA